MSRDSRPNSAEVSVAARDAIRTKANFLLAPTIAARAIAWAPMPAPTSKTGATGSNQRREQVKLWILQNSPYQRSDSPSSDSCGRYCRNPHPRIRYRTKASAQRRMRRTPATVDGRCRRHHWAPQARTANQRPPSLPAMPAAPVRSPRPNRHVAIGETVAWSDTRDCRLFLPTNASRGLRQHEPHRLAQCAGKMGNSSIDGEDKIKLIEHRRCVAKIVELRPKIFNRHAGTGGRSASSSRAPFCSA